MIDSLWDFVRLFFVSLSLWPRDRLKKLITLFNKTFTMQKKNQEDISLLLSLPNELILNCLARISKSYYPKLSLVSKTFRTLILSTELRLERFHLKTKETFFNVCLQFPNNPLPSIFTLWIKPGQVLTNQLEQETYTRNTRLVPIPFSYYPYVVRVGSEVYGLKQYNDPSSIMWVRNNGIFSWRNAPNMTVARARALAGVVNGKLYVMGGCAESANWGEVFDPKTQTWEPLPDPGAELRFSSIRKIELIQGKLYVRSNEDKDSVYDPKEGKWDVAKKSNVRCIIDNEWYDCDKHNNCLWYDKNRQEWRVVRGLDMLKRDDPCGFIEIANYGGKLLILWDKIEHPGLCEDKDIWCAMIAVERRVDTDEVWGNIEWANVVLTVPSS